MKLPFSRNGFKSLPHSRVLFFSTKPLTSTPEVKTDTLYSRISPVGDPRVSIVPILHQWIQEGKSIKREEFKGMIKQFYKLRRFKHALEISEWMSKQRYFAPSPGDVAERMNLISKVHGIEQAEKYFHTIPTQSKVPKVYNALLNCYADQKSVQNAEALLQHMRELGFARSSSVYNVLLNLYVQVGQYEKLDTIIEEMNEKRINQNIFTCRTRLSAYATISDIDGIEKTLQRMEEDSKVTMDWNSYAIAANGYIKAGYIDKGLEMLKKSENLVTGNKRRHAYDFLLTLYASARRKDELYRIWNLYKSSEKLYNTAYRCMIGSLLKLDDIAGAEKILEEWDSGDTCYDFNVPNSLLAAYCKNGLLEKAEKFVYKAIEKGKKPYANTWDCLATGYVEANQIPKAVEAMKAAFLVSQPGWKPNRDTLASCLVYLKQQGDMEKTEEFVRLLGSVGHLSTDDCDRLQDYICNRTTVVDKMKRWLG